ncbi:MAG: hypothetical protein U9P44_03150, partial [archaeon]|nr:hypothetical protein [archaeon]
EKKIEFYMGSSDVLILGIDNKRDLHKCYISAGENGSDEDSCVDNDVNDITGRFLAESNNGENWGKKGFFAWILGLLGF